MIPPEPQDQPVIELSDIHKSFSDLHVLKGVNLTANKGDVVAMIGSSGSGKSTLLRCVNLLEVPEKGNIAISGEDITFKPKGNDRLPSNAAQVNRIRANLSMVFQQFNLWAHLTIMDNVVLPQRRVLKRSKQEARQRATDTLRRVGIDDKADAFPAQLSGGQQQRAAIARASGRLTDDEPMLLYNLAARLANVERQLANAERR